MFDIGFAYSEPFLVEAETVSQEVNDDVPELVSAIPQTVPSYV